MQRIAAVGVAEHSNSVVLVTIAPGGELLDRRRVDLTDRGLPTHPHHHQGSWAVGRYLNTPGARALSLAEAVTLVERVRANREGNGIPSSLVVQEVRAVGYLRPDDPELANWGQETRLVFDTVP